MSYDVGLVIDTGGLEPVEVYDRNHTLTLSCHRVFEYAAEDGYDCRFVASGEQVTR